jgi:hypothetical protein
MSVIGSSILAGASGSAGGDKVYVDDVFSTFLYDGNGTARSINNGIDLAGEGGLVWIKNRTSAFNHALFDTERGVYKTLGSNRQGGEASYTSTLTSFNNNGFSLDLDNETDWVNGAPFDYASWTFRKAPGFFDVVTYSGTGSARTIAHNLGSVPGMIIVKVVSGATDDWFVYHRSLGDQRIKLNSTNASASTGVWNYTAPTSSVFSVGTDGGVNGSGRTYVAYIFAHDDAQFGKGADESIIKCGSYTGNGATAGPTINLGFEPQFVLLRCSTRPGGHGGGWYLFDSMRGIFSGLNDPTLQAQESNAEAASSNADIALTSTGFQATGSGVHSNASGGTYIYMAIRRPNKPPAAATDVFALDTGNSSSTIPAFDSGFPVDFAFRIAGYASGGNNPRALARLMGGQQLYTSLSNAQSGDNTDVVWDSMLGYEKTFTSSDIAWMFKRAPGFFDVVTYTGTGSTQSITHNLGVIPELQIVKNRSSGANWIVFTSKIDGSNDYLYLNTTSSANDSSQAVPSATTFTWTSSSSVINTSGNDYIAYLFATLPGISKVGTYSGTGSALNIDCGFTSGARFVLIKRTDTTGNWYLFDTARGIVSGNDFAIAINTTSAQISGDYIDPLAAGFTINGSYAQWNASGGTYLFLAIA